MKEIIHIFMDLIFLWINQIYYNMCRVIIVRNIANFSDNVTYANYSDKTDNKNAHTYQYSAIEVSQQGK